MAAVLATVTAAMILIAFAAGTAAGETTATYTATETIPVAPASSFSGASGGDGWAVALTPSAVYNVFHHQPVLDVACHLQADASPCWSTDYKTITDPATGDNFATSGQPGLWLDQSTGRLYGFATEYAPGASTGTGGVVCIDTTMPADDPDPFCGFTPLTGPNEASYNHLSAISDPAAVGSRWYAFNYVKGAAPGAGPDHTENTLLCFDLTTFQPCTGQPFTLATAGSGTDSDGDQPPPEVDAIGTQVIVPITLSDGPDQLACFDPTAAGDACTGSWPVALGFAYDSNFGAPFPMLSPSGALDGLCLPAETNTGTTDPCYALTGASAVTPPGMATAIVPTSGWNGPALILGPRVYVPDGNNNQIDCYDYSASSTCANFPLVPSQPLNILYTVNPDPERPTCIWINSDAGEILDFDAYTTGACGQGPIRVLASSLVSPAPQCTPISYQSLQVLSPAPGSYSDGSVSFEDFDGNPLPIAPQMLDNTGSVSLTGLNLNANGLPQFLVTLNGTQGAPTSLVLTLTWTGVDDPSCAAAATTVTVQNPGQPSVSSGAPTLASPTLAVFAGSVNPEGLQTTAYFQYGLDPKYTGGGPVRYTNSTPVETVRADFATQPVWALITGLVPNALYHFRLVATNASGTTYGPDMTFTTPKLARPAAPTLGKTFNLSVLKGIVLVKLSGGFVPLTQLRQLPVGTVIDARHGTVELTSAGPGVPGHTASAPRARGNHHTGKVKTQSGQFGGAIFRVAQARGGPSKGLVTLSLIEPTRAGASGSGTCEPHTAAEAAEAAAASASRTLQLLHASAHGEFRTSGRYASATGRGARWTIADRCDGTLIHDLTDSVAVTDFVRHKTIILHPGQSYLAPAPKRRR